VIPAKRIPASRSNWRFATAHLEKIREILTAAGLIEEEENASGTKRE
jgi:hypothetical protein